MGVWHRNRLAQPRFFMTSEVMDIVLPSLNTEPEDPIAVLPLEGKVAVITGDNRRNKRVEVTQEGY
jgi:hypothetical protein